MYMYLGGHIIFSIEVRQRNESKLDSAALCNCDLSQIKHSSSQKLFKIGSVEYILFHWNSK